MLFRQQLIQDQQIRLPSSLQSPLQLAGMVEGLKLPAQFLRLTAEEGTHRLIIVKDPNVHKSPCMDTSNRRPEARGRRLKLEHGSPSIDGRGSDSEGKVNELSKQYLENQDHDKPAFGCVAR
jgi:hypothetical protein